MSCRVVGLDVEVAMVSVVLNQLRQRGAQNVTAQIVETPTNLLSRDIWSRCGFCGAANKYIFTEKELALPKHITALEAGVSSG